MSSHHDIFATYVDAGDWLLHASATSSRVFSSQFVDDHGAVEQRRFAAIDIHAAAADIRDEGEYEESPLNTT